MGVRQKESGEIEESLERRGHSRKAMSKKEKNSNKSIKSRIQKLARVTGGVGRKSLKGMIEER